MRVCVLAGRPAGSGGHCSRRPGSLASIRAGGRERAARAVARVCCCRCRAGGGWREVNFFLITLDERSRSLEWAQHSDSNTNRPIALTCSPGRGPALESHTLASPRAAAAGRWKQKSAPSGRVCLFLSCRVALLARCSFLHTPAGCCSEPIAAASNATTTRRWRSMPTARCSLPVALWPPDRPAAINRRRRRRLNDSSPVFWPPAASDSARCLFCWPRAEVAIICGT
jgi:hypothetical protein